MAHMELTILMPCLDEAETIETCIRKASEYMASANISGEVLVADNGSTDGSQDIARNLGARVVDVPERGYGAALIAGIEAAHGKFVIMGDADDSYDFSALQPFMVKLREGAELVMGNRFKGGIAPGAMPTLHQYLGNPVLSFVGRLFFNIPVRDFHCGLRGFSRDAIRRLNLRSPGMEFASEMVVKSSLAGLRIEEVPTTLFPDGRSRPPHLRSWRDGWRHLRFLILHSPKWLFAVPGSIMVVLGLAGLVLLFGGPMHIAATLTLGIHTFAASCFLLLIGAQLLSAGLLTRRYATATGLLPPARGRSASLLRWLSLERLLLLSVCAVLAGLAGSSLSVWQWSRTGFSDIVDPFVLRTVLLSFTFITLGVQTGAAALLAAAMENAAPADISP